MQALEGLRLLDFGQYLAGPFGPMILGDLGMEVIKVEPVAGDGMRMAGAPFLGCQRGKRDLALNIKHPEGLELALELVRGADVVSFDIYPAVHDDPAVAGNLWYVARGVDPEVVKHLQRTEAGVRSLELISGTDARKVATQIAEGKVQSVVVSEENLPEYAGKPRYYYEVKERTEIPGVATGLWVTEMGGGILFVEATRYPSEKKGGQLIITGQLQDVMRESAQIAVSFIRSKAEQLGIDERVFDEFVRRFVDRTRELVVGDSTRADTFMGPVINLKAYERFQSVCERARADGEVLTGGTVVADGNLRYGYFCAPTVARLPVDHPYFYEELFVPFIAVAPVSSLEDALRLANDSEYGLTGAVFTSNPMKIDKAKRQFFVGNLYINRKCTGAMVGAHAVGGFNMASKDSKAGARDYRLLFTQAKVVEAKKG